jgi:hypothetical protein
MRVTSDAGVAYEFTRAPSLAEAWNVDVPIVDPAGLNSISVEIDKKCIEPTASQANFIDSFVRKYYMELWPTLEPMVQACLQNAEADGDAHKPVDISIYLPSVVSDPIHWGMQYSFESEMQHSFGLFIDFKNDDVVFVCGAD